MGANEEAPQAAREKGQKCPVCHKWHSAYALFAPACQKPHGDHYTYFVDGTPVYSNRVA